MGRRERKIPQDKRAGMCLDCAQVLSRDWSSGVLFGSAAGGAIAHLGRQVANAVFVQ